jgi:hypothetical protein
VRAVSCGGGERAVPAAAPGANDGKPAANTSFTKRKRDEKTETEVGSLDFGSIFKKVKKVRKVSQFLNLAAKSTRSLY